MLLQAVRFEGLPCSISPAEWKDKLEDFGHVEFIYFSSSHDSGYTIYSDKRAAVRAAEALHEMNMTADGSPLRFHLCSIEEVEDVVEITNPKIKLSNPEASSGHYFRRTQTQPPVFWRTKL